MSYDDLQRIAKAAGCIAYMTDDGPVYDTDVDQLCAIITEMGRLDFAAVEEIRRLRGKVRELEDQIALMQTGITSARDR